MNISQSNLLHSALIRGYEKDPGMRKDYERILRYAEEHAASGSKNRYTGNIAILQEGAAPIDMAAYWTLNYNDMLPEGEEWTETVPLGDSKTLVNVNIFRHTLNDKVLTRLQTSALPIDSSLWLHNGYHKDQPITYGTIADQLRKLADQFEKKGRGIVIDPYDES